ncbi:hypothetical protein Goklo_012525, partial [Gossypium klotzschianum]|nr:hypothetical protein [Gossypium klotzschianum]
RIDPEESFVKVKKYWLPQDEGVKSFISNPTAQPSGYHEVLERRGGILALKQIVRVILDPLLL